MRRVEQRIAPLPPEQWDEEQRDLMAPVVAGKGLARGVLNIFGTLIRYPKLYKRWAVFGNHTLFKTSLAPREREMVILRAAWRAQSRYEWGQHLSLGREAGLSEEEMERIKTGASDGAWSAADRCLLTAVDELVDDTLIADDTWAELKAIFAERQLMDLVFTVGQYTMLAMALNSFGVQLDDSIETLEKGRLP